MPGRITLGFHSPGRHCSCTKREAKREGGVKQAVDTTALPRPFSGYYYITVVASAARTELARSSPTPPIGDCACRVRACVRACLRDGLVMVWVEAWLGLLGLG